VIGSTPGQLGASCRPCPCLLPFVFHKSCFHFLWSARRLFVVFIALSASGGFWSSFLGLWRPWLGAVSSQGSLTGVLVNLEQYFVSTLSLTVYGEALAPSLRYSKDPTDWRDSSSQTLLWLLCLGSHFGRWPLLGVIAHSISQLRSPSARLRPAVACSSGGVVYRRRHG